VLFGPPGAGKGTQSALISKNYKLKHISTGDLLRGAMKAQTNLGLEAKKFMDKGSLVPDAVVIGLIREEMKKDLGAGMLLDGFPRNPAQAEALDELLKSVDSSVHKAIFLEVDRQELVSRLTGRRVCSQCGETFHVSSKPPRQASICDKCGGKLEQRVDDHEEVIVNRLDVYEKSTAPLKSYFEKQKKFVLIHGMGSPDQVFNLISQEIKGK
jgi:adenylate kinase